MQNRVTTAGPYSAGVANNIALSQSLAGAGSLTLNGSLVQTVQGPYTGGNAPYSTAKAAILSPAGQITITSAGNDSGATITITGTDWEGGIISETLAGANIGVVTSVLDYATVTNIAFSAATASTVTAGTAGTGGSPWIMLDTWAQPIISIQAVVSGTVNYTVLATLDDPNYYGNPIPPAQVTWDSTIFNLASKTTSASSSSLAAPTFVRVVVNSGTGSVRLTVSQLGAAPY